MGQRSEVATAVAPRLGLLAIAYLAFISIGLPDPVAGVAWPSVREVFGLPQSGFGLVFVGLAGGYLVSGFFGGTLTRMLGLGTLLAASSGLVAAAMFGSGLAPAWAVFVACAVVWGLGSGGVDAGLNAYAARHFSARQMNWLHACYSLGATLGPMLMTAMVVRAGSWRIGYGVVGVALFGMAALFLATRRRWDDPVRPEGGETASGGVSLAAALGDRLTLLQSALFFLYVGLEFVVGQWSFTLLTEGRGVRGDLAGALTGAYYGAIGVGRVIAGAITNRVGLDRLVRGSMGVALAGAVVLALDASTFASAVGLVVVGFGLAPIFPSLMAATPKRLGEGYAAHAVGFQVSAGMLGAGLIPGAAGLLADRTGLESVARLAVILAAMLLATHEIVLATWRRRS